jgi:predicted GTPase
MTPEEMMVLEEAIRNMREGNLSKKEKVLFVVGIQAGLYSDDKKVQDMLNEVAELCLNEPEEDCDVDVSEIKNFDN